MKQTTHYYTGGLAELVSSPSYLTATYLKKWFTGSGSLGKAMSLLNLPFEKNEHSILTIYENELVVDLDVEENTLYSNTIFSYRFQENKSDLPRLSINFRKLFIPKSLLNTFKITLTQAKWISAPIATAKFAEHLLQTIPDMPSEDPENTLKDSVWPVVIAIGAIAEFYNQYLLHENKKNIEILNEYISHRISNEDWFFRSISDQYKVLTEEMLFEEYMKLYGMRSDKDYELTAPRWHEIPELVKSRISKSKMHRISQQAPLPQLGAQLRQIVETSAELQLLRSEAKRKALVHIDRLRQNILKNNPDLSYKAISTVSLKKSKENKVTKGKGMPVSKGIVIGKIYTCPHKLDHTLR